MNKEEGRAAGQTEANLRDTVRYWTTVARPRGAAQKRALAAALAELAKRQAKGN